VKNDRNIKKGKVILLHDLARLIWQMADLSRKKDRFQGTLVDYLYQGIG